MTPRPVRTYKKADLSWMEVWEHHTLSGRRRFRWWDGERVIQWYAGKPIKDWYANNPADLHYRGYRPVYPQAIQYPEGV